MIQLVSLIFLSFIVYYLSKTVVLIHLTISFVLTLFIYCKVTKNFFPRMKLKKDENFKTKVQYFHELYPSVERYDLHLISFGQIFLGFATYFWIKVIAASISMSMMNIPFK